MNKSISVLGCGWLGLPLAKSLAKAGYEMKGTTTHPEKLSIMRDGGIRPYLLELNPEVPEKHSFFDCYTLIVNLPPRNIKNDPNFYQKQLESIRCAAAKHGVRQVIFVSSTGVYIDNNQAVTESGASYQGLSRAGISLLAMEELFKTDSFDTTIIRFGGLYGPDRHPGNFLKGKQNVPGADNPINMIHLDDCIGIIHFILNDSLMNETFNATSPNLPHREAFYQAAAKELGVEPPVFTSEPKPFKKVCSALIQSKGYQFIH